MLRVQGYLIMPYNNGRKYLIFSQFYEAGDDGLHYSELKNIESNNARAGLNRCLKWILRKVIFRQNMLANAFEYKSVYRFNWKYYENVIKNLTNPFSLLETFIR